MRFPHSLVLRRTAYQESGGVVVKDPATGYDVQVAPVEIVFQGWLQPAAPQTRVQETALARQTALEAEEAGLAFSSHVLFAPLALQTVAKKGDEVRRVVPDGLRYTLIADPQDAAGRGHHVECDLAEVRYPEDLSSGQAGAAGVSLADYLAAHPDALQGPVGPSGPAGPMGPAEQPFTYTQGVAAAVWNIAHNLNSHPAVVVVDGGGNEVEGEVDYLDANNIRITFAVPFAGVAFLT